MQNLDRNFAEAAKLMEFPVDFPVSIALSLLKDGRAVFNIAGNKYRIVWKRRQKPAQFFCWSL
jgi:mRNA-degrading endonuclease HigB of HigAB toxin-antitoxin module